MMCLCVLPNFNKNIYAPKTHRNSPLAILRCTTRQHLDDLINRIRNEKIGKKRQRERKKPSTIKKYCTFQSEIMHFLCYNVGTGNCTVYLSKTSKHVLSGCGYGLSTS